MALDFEYSELLAVGSTTSASYVTRLSHVLTPVANTDYLIFASWNSRGNSGFYDFRVRLHDVTNGNTYSIVESTKYAWNNYQWPGGFGCGLFQAGASPVDTTFAIQIAAESSKTTYVYDCRICIVKLPASHNVEYAEALGVWTHSGSGSGEQTAHTLTFTPAEEQDYIIISSCNPYHFHTSKYHNNRVKLDGVVQRHLQTTNNRWDIHQCFPMVSRQTLDATSHTLIQTSYRSGSSSTFRVSGKVLMAIPVALFDSVENVAENSPTTTSTTAVQMGTQMTFTPAATHSYLVLGAALRVQTGTGSYGDAMIYIDGSQHTFVRSNEGGTWRDYASAITEIVELDNTSHTIDYYGKAGTSQTLTLQNATLAALQLTSAEEAGLPFENFHRRKSAMPLLGM